MPDWKHHFLGILDQPINISFNHHGIRHNVRFQGKQNLNYAISHKNVEWQWDVPNLLLKLITDFVRKIVGLTVKEEDKPLSVEDIKFTADDEEIYGLIIPALERELELRYRKSTPGTPVKVPVPIILYHISMKSYQIAMKYNNPVPLPRLVVNRIIDRYSKWNACYEYSEESGEGYLYFDV